MRLLDSFKEQIAKLGELKHVWLTSFNTNIEFIEKYLLPAALAMDPPKNRLDYEHIQLALIEKQIDFQVFCDKRFMETDLNKRTAISVHGVSPRRFKEVFSKESLFHPKVIYLEDVNGNKIVGAGSANLTIGGWGRNQEVFHFFEIEAMDQYRSVKSFFDKVFENVGLECPLINRNRRSFDKESGTWTFVHSFQEGSFLEQLFSDDDSDDLIVWSPYLPGDLPAFIAKLKNITGKESLKVHLVPDRIEGKYIRTQWSQNLSDLMSRGELVFYQNPSFRHENVELCHAKIWKIGGRLALGSWNFTGPGSNILVDDNDEWSPDNNIEAGFIVENNHLWRQIAGKELILGQGDFASSSLLRDEELTVPEELPFDIRISFNWGTQCYVFDGEWQFGVISGDYWLKVPDAPKPIRLDWLPRKKTLDIPPLEIDRPEQLLIEHRFEVILNNSTVCRGLITETNLPFRRVQAYESLSDLLNAFISGADVVSWDSVPFRIPVDPRSDFVEDEHENELQAQVVNTDADISYFRLFQASRQYCEKIDAIDNVPELNQWVFARPGCLQELVEKTKKKIDSAPRIFDWFLAQEVISLCMRARRKQLELGISDKSLPASRWDALHISLPRLPRGIQKDYIKLIQRECRYVRA